ncbi:hypothetical protein JMA_00680 [Jeotgalibacillus malaysiensis]|uniref:Uncharacterized protein n=1 Tax=Jeotgalibacillus malaysiensis TaxID=1508404 RepID=A0A0B5AGC6_9BACL|nr:hypothetical protein JMA_00680 [Jeotgalibacillus malaysiensis]
MQEPDPKNAGSDRKFHHSGFCDLKYLGCDLKITEGDRKFSGCDLKQTHWPR